MSSCRWHLPSPRIAGSSRNAPNARGMALGLLPRKGMPIDKDGDAAFRYSGLNMPVGVAYRNGSSFAPRSIMSAAAMSEHFISALITVFVDDCVDVAFLPAADEQGAVLPKCHTACIRNIVRIDRDGKTRGQFDRIEREGAGIDPVLDEEDGHREDYQRNNTTHRIAIVPMVRVHDYFLMNRLKTHCPSIPIIGGTKRAGKQRARVKGQPSSGAS